MTRPTLLPLFGLLLLGPAAHAMPVSFSDGDFADAEWEIVEEGTRRSKA